MIYIGFDFSINKPACTVIEVNGDDVKYTHYCWPYKATKNALAVLKSADINVSVQDRHVSDKTYSGDMISDVTNARRLASLICDTLSVYFDNPDDVYIAQEGFSYGSKGASILDLAGYKYILMDYLNRYVPFSNMLTYAPSTVKKIAGCSKKDNNKKDNMIEAFKSEQLDTKFKNILKNNPTQLVMKTNFVICVDDIVDSYWVAKTMLNDLNIKL